MWATFVQGIYNEGLSRFTLQIDSLPGKLPVQYFLPMFDRENRKTCFNRVVRGMVEKGEPCEALGLEARAERKRALQRGFVGRGLCGWDFVCESVQVASNERSTRFPQSTTTNVPFIFCHLFIFIFWGTTHRLHRYIPSTFWLLSSLNGPASQCAIIFSRVNSIRDNCKFKSEVGNKTK